MEQMGVAIIGCGLIGKKRASSLGPTRLVICVDVNGERAKELAHPYKADWSLDWRLALSRPDVQIVIVAASNDSLAEITAHAVRAGKHVLVEKPAARNLEEITQVATQARQSPGLVRVGFNHRYHPAVRQALEIFKSGALGEMMFVRGRYGHGGRTGYEKEWRADPARSGGGELLDQGSHLIDLARCFLGDFEQVQGFAHTYFWEMPVDDNGFALLRTPAGQTAFLHASCTEWKNMFSFEVYGKKAKLQIDGLGGSYGLERLTYYQMRPEMGPPDTVCWEYPRGDDSWQMEYREFLEDIRLQRQPAASLEDAVAVHKIVDIIYRESGYDYHT
jgi:predicted dehydrogenase